MAQTVVAVQEIELYKGEKVIVHKETDSYSVVMKDKVTNLQTTIDNLESKIGGTKEPVHGIPSGGAVNSALLKNTATDYDAGWKPIDKSVLAPSLQTTITKAEALNTGGVANDSFSLGGVPANQYMRVGIIPTPTLADKDKVLGVNASGQYALTTASASVQQVVAAGNHMYDGVDLTAKFSEEISTRSAGDPWAWIQNRIRTNSIADISIGDYISFVSNSNNLYRMCVAGISTYFGYDTDNPTRKFIDFISKDCYNLTYSFNRFQYNNGLSTEENPFMASELYMWMNGLKGNVVNGTGTNPPVISVDHSLDGGWTRLPATLRAVIIKKKVLMPVRYSATATLNDDTNYVIKEVGPLWLPSEMEVFGTTHFSTRGWGSGCHNPYPLFQDTRHKVKGLGDGGPSVDWWSCSSRGSSSRDIVVINRNGAANVIGANSAYFIPLCFRIG